jgi:hypothetical protein
MQGFAEKLSDFEGAVDILAQIMIESNEFGVKKADGFWLVNVRAPGANTELKFAADEKSQLIANTLQQLLDSMRKKNPEPTDVDLIPTIRVEPVKNPNFVKAKPTNVKPGPEPVLAADKPAAKSKGATKDTPAAAGAEKKDDAPSDVPAPSVDATKDTTGTDKSADKKAEKAEPNPLDGGQK